MPEVTLSRAWNPGGEYHAAGDVIEVDEATASWLRQCGALVEAKAVRKRPRVKVAEPKGEPEAEPEVKVSQRPTPPKKTESLTKWREYALRVGVNPKSLTKRELISATT